jgi:glutathione synthase/RimK-type ligase-like ATP-grasp enzyme
MIRNHQSRRHSQGVWVFMSIGQDQIPDGVVRESIKAVKALGMNFGAVDIGWSPEEGAKLFEVNSAPGIEGPTLTSYCQKIAELARA